MFLTAVCSSTHAANYITAERNSEALVHEQRSEDQKAWCIIRGRRTSMNYRDDVIPVYSKVTATSLIKIMMFRWFGVMVTFRLFTDTLNTLNMRDIGYMPSCGLPVCRQNWHYQNAADDSAKKAVLLKALFLHPSWSCDVAMVVTVALVPLIHLEDV